MESEFLHSSFLLEELDYDAQLLAIRSLLFRQERADQELADRIGKIGKVAKQTSGIANDWAVDEWVDLVHSSCYQDAAHSMAAVGMIAPFIESIFRHAFPRIGDKKTYKGSMVEKIMSLADEEKIRNYLPDDLEPTLSALFAYRNAMFHSGFEWPREELEKFEMKLNKSGWPSDWFLRAMSNDKPWMFYMSPKFIEHCLGIVEEVIRGIEEFDMDKY